MTPPLAVASAFAKPVVTSHVPGHRRCQWAVTLTLELLHRSPACHDHVITMVRDWIHTITGAAPGGGVSSTGDVARLWNTCSTALSVICSPSKRRDPGLRPRRPAAGVGGLWSGRWPVPTLEDLWSNQRRAPDVVELVRLYGALGTPHGETIRLRLQVLVHSQEWL